MVVSYLLYPYDIQGVLYTTSHLSLQQPYILHCSNEENKAVVTKLASHHTMTKSEFKLKSV